MQSYSCKDYTTRYTSPSLLNNSDQSGPFASPYFEFTDERWMHDGYKDLRPIVYQCLRQAMMQSSCARFDLKHSENCIYLAFLKDTGSIRWFSQRFEPGSSGARISELNLTQLCLTLIFLFFFSQSGIYKHASPHQSLHYFQWYHIVCSRCF